MDFIDLIKSRRSIRSFLDKPVSREVLEVIIDCGRYAPTALGRQPWYFTVVTDGPLIREIVHEVKKKIRLMLKFRFLLPSFYPYLKDKKFLAIARERAYSTEDRIFYAAPVLILISAPSRSPYRLKDSYLAAQNIMLASHSVGLGTCLVGLGEAINKCPALRKKLNLPAGHRLQATIALGYPRKEVAHLPERRRDNLTII